MLRLILGLGSIGKIASELANIPNGRRIERLNEKSLTAMARLFKSVSMKFDGLIPMERLYHSFCLNCQTITADN